MDNSARTAMPMKWHKFLIYFGLWLSAAISVIYSYWLLTGSVHGYDEVNTMYSINWNRQYYPDARRLSFSEMLNGPGFHVMNFINESPMTGNAHYTFLNVFHDEYRLLEKFGGYPPGDYTLDFFFCGYKVYTMRFTLN